MIMLTLLDTGGLRLADTESGEVYDLPGDRDSQRLGRLIRRLATNTYATGHADGLDDGYQRAMEELEQRERRGPQRRAKLALN